MTEKSISDHVSGGFYVPKHGDTKADGSPIHTVNTVGPLVAELDQVAGIVGEIPTTMFVTTSKWARIAREVETLTKAINPANFRCLNIRNLTVVDANSEDEQAVNLLNVPEARKCDFQNRRQRLITGKK